MRGGAEYSPNTHKVLYSDTTTHTFKLEMTYWQAGRHTHPHSVEMLLTDTPVKGTPRCQKTL